MKEKRHIFLLILIAALLCPAYARNLEPAVEQALASLKPQHLGIGEIKLKSLSQQKGNRLVVVMNDEFSYLPFREELVKRAYDTVRSILPKNLKKKLAIYAGGNEISRLIPFADSHKRFAVN